MPYENEYASGESLWRFLDNESVRRFQGEIQTLNTSEPREFPHELEVQREASGIKHIIVIDGSDVVHQVQNGFPMAEASLVNIAGVVINVQELYSIEHDEIVRPQKLRDIETVKTMGTVLPGPNVIGSEKHEREPKKYFRATFRKEFDFKLDPDHESLLETFLSITEPGRIAKMEFQCPITDCDRQLKRPGEDGICPCPERENVYITDSLRAHERFYNNMSSQQAYTAFRTVVEHILLVNILRYFHQKCDHAIFDDIGFVIDGPLAVFGMPAWVKDYIEREIAQIHRELIEEGRQGVLLMGVEKTGQFVTHLEELDWLTQEGPRQKLANGTVLIPTTEYIYRYVFPSDSDKTYGAAVNYGRKILYKNWSGQHAVLMLPIVNAIGRAPNSVAIDAFPRLNDALDIVDNLHTHLYKDGFAPLVRAHAHAAIPLRMGQRILDSIFEE